MSASPNRDSKRSRIPSRRSPSRARAPETLKKKPAVDAEGGAGEEDDDEPGNVLLEPKRLLAMLTRCKRDPELSMRFAFIDAKDKQGAVFAMHPKMSAKKLFA